jgi:hypothetical protein
VIYFDCVIVPRVVCLAWNCPVQGPQFACATPITTISVELDFPIHIGPH